MANGTVVWAGGIGVWNWGGTGGGKWESCTKLIDGKAGGSERIWLL